jgi:hypothetical protein
LRNCGAHDAGRQEKCDCGRDHSGGIHSGVFLLAAAGERAERDFAVLGIWGGGAVDRGVFWGVLAEEAAVSYIGVKLR